MKSIIIASILILFSIQMNAQEIINKKHSFTVAENKPVKIELDGEIVIASWENYNAEINVETKATGDVWGIHSDKDGYKKYDVIIDELSNEIRISPRKRSGSFMIGVSTLEVRNRHIIYLPKHARVFLKSDEADIVVKGEFEVVDIDFDDGFCRLDLNKNDFKLLECRTVDGRIYSNNENQGESLKVFASGNSIYSVFTDEGRIELDIEE